MNNKYAKLLQHRKDQNSSWLDMRCVECGEKIYTEGMKRWDAIKHDTRNGGADTYFYCDNEECLSKERLSNLPKEYPTCTILEDEVNYVTARYQYGYGDSEIINRIRCHWSTKGRFITIKNKRVYL